MIDELVAPNFRLSEFVDSDTATRLGLDNTPPSEAMANIRNVLAPGMQSVRDCLREGVFMCSGYRSLLVNRAIGSADTSQHIQGTAGDFKSPAFGMPDTIVRCLMEHRDRVRYDQLICEGTWVHVSFSPNPRGEVLLAHFSPGKKTTYTVFA